MWSKFMTQSFLENYQKNIIPKLAKRLNKKNLMAIPHVTKVVVNIGIGDIAKDKERREKAISTLSAITGQTPQIRPAKKAVAEFKIRKGDPVGLKVTLRGKRAYDFLGKLFTIVLPRVRDFQGLKENSFDKTGNYTLALSEQIIFPEVDYDKIDRIRGMEITIITNTSDNKEAKILLEEMGMPFEKIKDKK